MDFILFKDNCCSGCSKYAAERIDVVELFVAGEEIYTLCARCLRQALALLESPGWSSTPPTEQGWYWARDFAGESMVASVERDSYGTQELRAWVVGIDVSHPLSDFEAWGPRLAPPG